jgi:hypothetical protein
MVGSIHRTLGICDDTEDFLPLSFRTVNVPAGTSIFFTVQDSTQSTINSNPQTVVVRSPSRYCSGAAIDFFFR